MRVELVVFGIEWCDDAAANLHNEIKTGAKSQEDLEAAISKATADIEASSGKIEDLSGAISADEKELKEATAVRWVFWGGLV